MMYEINLTQLMTEFDAIGKEIPMFCVMRQYMQMVMDMLMFIRSERTADWDLHLLSTKRFTKYSFAHDKINYSRMIPVYLSDMSALKAEDTYTYQEFPNGDWIVNKNLHISFGAIAADHVLEQLNRSMKVYVGLTGITLNENARTKFFLLAPELSRLALETKDMIGLTSSIQGSHHGVSGSATRRHQKLVDDVSHAWDDYSNPFIQSDEQLFNLVTSAVMPETIKTYLCIQATYGQQLFDEFVANHINSNTVSIWATIKKCQLQTWKTTAKKVELRLDEKVMILKEDCSLFARLLNVSKSRKDVSLENAVGNFELSVIPQGHCSVLMDRCFPLRAKAS